MTDTKLILEAIATKRCIDVTYNRTNMRVAPHVLYTRHGDLFIDAVALEREGVEPRELKLGTFKLIGLQIAGITDRTFDPFVDFDATNEKYFETTPFAVD